MPLVNPGASGGGGAGLPGPPGPAGPQGLPGLAGAVGPAGPKGADAVLPSTKLHSTADKLKFVMYWPRLSPTMDWWKELAAGRFTWTDVSNDLDQIKSVLGVNAVRVFTYYDHEFRQTGVVGWTDGNGNHNPARLAALKQFIELAATKGLDVIVTMYQIMPALKVGEDWSWLESKLTQTLSFHEWLLNGIKDYANVKAYNLMNEPDGYGVADDVALMGRVLTWLNALRNRGKTVAPNLKCIVNTTTHDNFFKRYPTGPVGANSVYEVSDVVAQNSFLFADTGFWAGTVYQTQLAYMLSKNVEKKPVIMTECGFPANYAQQNVAGFNGATATDESIVPQGGIFDRPQGVATGRPHTPANQALSVAEAVAIAEKYNIDGLGIWSAYDHKHATAPYVYRDPFGVIDPDGNPLPACALFKAAFTNTYPVGGRKRMTLTAGSVSTDLDSRINGAGGYNSAQPTHNTPAGVFLAAGNNSPQQWQSGKLPVQLPAVYEIAFTIRSAYTVPEPFLVRVIAAGKVMDWRYKVYTVNSWQRINATSGDVDRGFASNSPVLGAGAHTFSIDLSGGLDPIVKVDGVTLNYSAAGTEPFLPWQTTDGVQLLVMNKSDSLVDITALNAVGADGAKIPVALAETNDAQVHAAIAAVSAASTTATTALTTAQGAGSTAATALSAAQAAQTATTGLDTKYTARPITQALAKFHAALGLRNSKPVVVVPTGSSSTQGNNASSAANSYVGRLNTMLQTRYPLDTPSTPALKTLSVAAGTTPGLGINVVNAGIGGTTSADFLTNTTMDQIIALRPDLIPMMVGSNDLHNGLPLATYEANVRAKIAYMKARITWPCALLLIQSYERFDAGSPVATWDEYGAVLRKIAAEDPDFIAFVDVSPNFTPLGIPGPDPLDLIDTDLVHMRDAGHLLMATLLFEAIMAKPLLPDLSYNAKTVRNFVAPAISGDASAGVGTVLTATNGTWSNTLGGVATTYTYQWNRAGAPITGATAQSYTMVSADLGVALTVTVTAVRAGWVSTSAVSAAVNSSTVSALVSTVAPAVTGNSTTGSVLTTTNGTWTGSPTSYTYAWQRDGVAISGATSSTYTLVSADETHAITCKVTAAKSGTASVTQTAGNFITAVAAGGGTDITSGLLFDLDADSITGVANNADVTSWQSTTGSLGTFALTNSGTNAPALLTNYVNGHAAIDFDVANTEALRTVSTTQPTWTGPTTLAFVIRADLDQASAGRIFTSRDASNYLAVSNAAGGGVMAQAMGGNTATRPTSVAGAWHIVVLVANGGASSLQVDQTAPVAVTWGTVTHNAITVGSSVNLTAGTFYDGKVAEIRGFNRAFSTQEVTALVNSLATKYGIAV